MFFQQAQQLPAPVTSATRLKSQRHQLYLLKDEESNGCVSVGICVYICMYAVIHRWVEGYIDTVRPRNMWTVTGLAVSEYGEYEL